MGLAQKSIGAAVGIGMNVVGSAVDTVKDVAGLGLNAVGLGKDKKAGANAADAKKGGAESTLDGAALESVESGHDLASQEKGMDQRIDNAESALGAISNFVNPSASVARANATKKGQEPAAEQPPQISVVQPIINVAAQIANALLGSNKDDKKQSQSQGVDDGIGLENAASMNFEEQRIARQKRQGVGGVPDSDDDMSAGAEFDETPDSKQAPPEKGTSLRVQIAASIASVVDDGIEMDSSAQEPQKQQSLRLGPPTSDARSSSEAAIGNAFKDVKQSSALSTSVPTMATDLAQNLAIKSGGPAK